MVFTGEGDHGAEGGAAGLLGSLDIDELFSNLELAARSVRSQQIELGRNGEAFAFLVFRRDAGVENCGADTDSLWLKE
jgi:hypothetical protein